MPKKTCCSKFHRNTSITLTLTLILTLTLTQTLTQKEHLQPVKKKFRLAELGFEPETCTTVFELARTCNDLGEKLFVRGFYSKLSTYLLTSYLYGPSVQNVNSGISLELVRNRSRISPEMLQPVRKKFRLGRACFRAGNLPNLVRTCFDLR